MSDVAPLSSTVASPSLGCLPPSASPPPDTWTTTYTRLAEMNDPSKGGSKYIDVHIGDGVRVESGHHTDGHTAKNTSVVTSPVARDRLANRLSDRSRASHGAARVCG